MVRPLVEACNLLIVLAESFKDKFELIADKFISKESLLKCINIANKVIAE